MKWRINYISRRTDCWIVEQILKAKITGNAWQTMQGIGFGSVKPLIPKSDWPLISPFRITLKLNVKVMRILEMITNLRSSWFSNKFSRKCWEISVEIMNTKVMVQKGSLHWFKRISQSYAITSSPYSLPQTYIVWYVNNQTSEKVRLVPKKLRDQSLYYLKVSILTGKMKRGVSWLQQNKNWVP